MSACPLADGSPLEGAAGSATALGPGQTQPDRESTDKRVQDLSSIRRTLVLVP
jgi:hypothetical protein